MTITRGLPYPLGAQADATGVNFAYVCKKTECGVVLFDKKTLKEKKRIPFPAEYAIGNVYSMHVDGLVNEIAYCFYEIDKEQETLVTDSRGKIFLGNRKYNEPENLGKVNPAGFVTEDYDWENDKPLETPYEKSIGYCMHVRGFTKHTSSKVKAKGCFAGIVEKIPYLRELGITLLELQPAYEFEELTAKKKTASTFYIDRENEKEEYKLNYWGYTEGYYYAPKNSYTYGGDAVKEFKDMVKELHRNGIEVVMQFYFTDNMFAGDIVDILRHWLIDYHVDGFHLKGENIPANEIAKDPVLARTKIWYYGFDIPGNEVVYGQKKQKYPAEYRDDYRYDMRRFLKGDEGMLQSVMHHLRCNPASMGRINYLTNYDGFTLYDLVSYERKHNEENGEDNKDGNDFNASWNCGQEGVSRKKTVHALRMKQIKNALMLLLLSQSTPLIFMGDEFCNSQEGNNNPYCLDNKTTWLNWKETEAGKEIFSFTKSLIALRKEHPVLCQEKELRMLDYGACGYPDLSYHGEAPWKADMACYSRQLGVMYCGKYAYREKNTPDDFFYVAYNMHWEPCSFALPKLPKGLGWQMCISSDATGACSDEEQNVVNLEGRCICLFVSIPCESEKTVQKEKKRK